MSETRSPANTPPATQPAPPPKEPYRFPPELEQFRPYLAHPGREEELMNSPVTPFNNWPVYAMHCAMDGQLALLARLHRAGLLLPADQAAPAPEAGE